MANDADDAGTTPITELSISLRMGVARLSRRIRAEKAAEDISDSQYTVLVHLFRDGPHTLGELSEAERVTPPSMNRTVNCLVDAGYVERTSAPDDGRKVVVQATDSGRLLVTETRRRRNAWLVGLLEELTPEQRDMLTEAAAVIRELADS
jgi:DNA-binding MarR family transcriptional regulator